jgi:hypothetical protein
MTQIITNPTHRTLEGDLDCIKPESKARGGRADTRRRGPGVSA